MGFSIEIKAADDIEVLVACQNLRNENNKQTYFLHLYYF